MSMDYDQARSKGVGTQGARPPTKSDLVFLNLGNTVETRGGMVVACSQDA